MSIIEKLPEAPTGRKWAVSLFADAVTPAHLYIVLEQDYSFPNPVVRDEPYVVVDPEKGEEAILQSARELVKEYEERYARGRANEEALKEAQGKYSQLLAR